MKSTDGALPPKPACVDSAFDEHHVSPSSAGPIRRRGNSGSRQRARSRLRMLDKFPAIAVARRSDFVVFESRPTAAHGFPDLQPPSCTGTRHREHAIRCRARCQAIHAQFAGCPAHPFRARGQRPDRPTAGTHPRRTRTGARAARVLDRRVPSDDASGKPFTECSNHASSGYSCRRAPGRRRALPPPERISDVDTRAPADPLLDNCVATVRGGAFVRTPRRTGRGLVKAPSGSGRSSGRHRKITASATMLPPRAYRPRGMQLRARRVIIARVDATAWRRPLPAGGSPRRPVLGSSELTLPAALVRGAVQREDRHRRVGLFRRTPPRPVRGQAKTDHEIVAKYGFPVSRDRAACAVGALRTWTQGDDATRRNYAVMTVAYADAAIAADPLRGAAAELQRRAINLHRPAGGAVALRTRGAHTVQRRNRARSACGRHRVQRMAHQQCRRATLSVASSSAASNLWICARWRSRRYGLRWLERAVAPRHRIVTGCQRRRIRTMPALRTLAGLPSATAGRRLPAAWPSAIAIRAQGRKRKPFAA